MMKKPEPDEEHATQEEPDVSAQGGEPSAEDDEQPCGMAQESEKTSKDQVQTGEAKVYVVRLSTPVITNFAVAQSASEEIFMNWKRNV